MRTAAGIVAVLFLAFAGIAGAFPEDSSGRAMPPRGGPPPAAKEACASASEGDGCSFEGFGDRMVSGRCETVRDELACVPDEIRGRMRRRE